jgi:hypothetical protein
MKRTIEDGNGETGVLRWTFLVVVFAFGNFGLFFFAPDTFC